MSCPMCEGVEMFRQFLTKILLILGLQAQQLFFAFTVTMDSPCVERVMSLSRVGDDVGSRVHPPGVFREVGDMSMGMCSCPVIFTSIFKPAEVPSLERMDPTR